MARFDVEGVDYRSHSYLPIVDWGCSNRDGRSWTSMKKELYGSSDSSRINKYTWFWTGRGPALVKVLSSRTSSHPGQGSAHHRHSGVRKDVLTAENCSDITALCDSRSRLCHAPSHMASYSRVDVHFCNLNRKGWMRRGPLTLWFLLYITCTEVRVINAKWMTWECIRDEFDSMFNTGPCLVLTMMIVATGNVHPVFLVTYLRVLLETHFKKRYNLAMAESQKKKVCEWDAG